MIEILAKDMEVDLDDLDEYETEDERYTLALEFYDYNTNGAYVGEFTLHIHVKKKIKNNWIIIVSFKTTQ
jgi:hypothetical protein